MFKTASFLIVRIAVPSTLVLGLCGIGCVRVVAPPSPPPSQEAIAAQSDEIKAPVSQADLATAHSAAEISPDADPHENAGSKLPTPASVRADSQPEAPAPEPAPKLDEEISKPVCSQVGTRSEGWYRDGKVVLIGKCEGFELLCAGIDTRGEGWYANQKLVEYDNCDGMHAK